jgi:hypothetical protein
MTRRYFEVTVQVIVSDETKLQAAAEAKAVETGWTVRKWRAFRKADPEKVHCDVLMMLDLTGGFEFPRTGFEIHGTVSSEVTNEAGRNWPHVMREQSGS